LKDAGLQYNCKEEWKSPLRLYFALVYTMKKINSFERQRMTLAGIAQLVEQWIEDPRVTSSNLVPGIFPS
jgi:hypothetical protein